MRKRTAMQYDVKKVGSDSFLTNLCASLVRFCDKMQLTNPNLVYTIIFEKIAGFKVAPASAALFLDEFFKKRDKTKILTTALSQMGKKVNKNQKELKQNCEIMRVILIDELDALMTKK